MSARAHAHTRTRYHRSPLPPFTLPVRLQFFPPALKLSSTGAHQMSPLSSFVTNSFDVRNLSVRPLRQKSLNPFTSRGGLVLGVHRLEGGRGREGEWFKTGGSVCLSGVLDGRPHGRPQSRTAVSPPVISLTLSTFWRTEGRAARDLKNYGPCRRERAAPGDVSDGT